MIIRLLFISIICLCVSFTHAQEKVPVFETYSINNVNSRRADFCPVVVEDKLIFVSERESDLLNLGEINYSWAPHTTIMYSKIKRQDSITTYSPPRLYKPAYFSNSSHVGPITFMNQNMIYSKVDMSIRDSAGISRPRIYMEGHVFEYNSLNYSCSQPSIDQKNMVLYFTSDMPGGYGGSDIWKTEFKMGEWQKPENMGAEINTVANESFPYYHKESQILYYSSDKDGGLGGLDVYYAKMKSNQWVSYDIKESLNSVNDDFGLYIYPDGKSGFFTSGAPKEGKKNAHRDEIYGMNISWKDADDPNTEKGLVMAGYFSYKTLANDAPEGLKVYLVDDEGNVVYTTQTNEKGFFSFQDLDPETNYFIKIDATDQDMELKILGDSSDDITAVLSNDKTGMFLYRELSFEQIGSMGLLYTTDDAEMNEGALTRSFNGQFRYKYLNSDELGGLVVQLIDDEGNIVYTTTTDDQGIFAFKNLPVDKNYIVKLAEENPDIELLAINDEGVIAELNQNSRGEFVFVKMARSSANALNQLMVEDISMFSDTNTVMAQFGSDKLKKSFFVKKTVLIKNKLGKLVMSGVTNDEGQIFIDKTIDKDTLSFEVLDLKQQPKVWMRLVNHDDEEIALIFSDNGIFKYQFLEGAETGDPTMIDEEDFILALDGREAVDEGEVMVEKVTEDILVIYFGINSAEYNFAGNKELVKLVDQLKQDPNLQIDITAFSDKTGTAEYNKELSIRRAKGVVNYLTSNGIALNRITYRGFGATNFAVRCDQCTDQQNQLNRRAVLKIN